MNVGKKTNHLAVITIFIGGMNTIPTWVIYGIVLPTLISGWWFLEQFHPL